MPDFALQGVVLYTEANAQSGNRPACYMCNMAHRIFTKLSRPKFYLTYM